RNGQIDSGGTDRIKSTLRDVTAINSINVLRIRTYSWATNSSSVSNLISETRVSTEGLTNWNISFGLTNQTVTSYSGGHKYITTTVQDGACYDCESHSGRLLSR